MQSFRKPNPRKSSKPKKGWNQRRKEIADSISVPENTAMVACSECVRHGVVCYYSREQSVKCAACLRHQRDCDGTFSVEEFRKVGEQKKLLQAKSRAKRREIQRLRKTLADAQVALANAESSDADVQDDLARLDEMSNRMLRREMLALGALNPLETEQEVALAEPGFAWEGLPVTDSVDWAVVFGSSGGTGSPVPR
jgi:hypothetical protein